MTRQRRKASPSIRRSSFSGRPARRRSRWRDLRPRRSQGSVRKAAAMSPRAGQSCSQLRTSRASSHLLERTGQPGASFFFLASLPWDTCWDKGFLLRWKMPGAKGQPLLVTPEEAQSLETILLPGGPQRSSTSPQHNNSSSSSSSSLLGSPKPLALLQTLQQLLPRVYELGLSSGTAGPHLLTSRAAALMIAPVANVKTDAYSQTCWYLSRFHRF